MKSYIRLCLSSSLALIGAVLVPARGVLAEKTQSGVVSALEKKYVVTETTPDFAQITKDGTTMAMKCPGVYSAPTSMMVKPETKVVDGKVQAPAVLTRMTWTKMGAHVLQTGDKVYITKMEGKSELTGDVVRFTLLTVDELDVSGSQAKKKFEATVSFKFKKGYLEETPPDQVEQTIESVLAPDEGGSETKSAEAAAPTQPSARPGAPLRQQAVAPTPAAVPVAAPAAAPPTPTATISIGESSTEVLQAMGMPLQMIDLGKKKTYVYKNMKIVFLNDKVSDVQ